MRSWFVVLALMSTPVVASAQDAGGREESPPEFADEVTFGPLQVLEDLRDFHLTEERSEAGTRYDFGGRFTVDTIKWGYRNRRDSGVEAGDARPTFTATSLNLQAHLELDLLGRDTPRNLYEAWAGAWLSRQIRVRLGQMRIPLGTEFASREEHLPLPGYAFVSHLDGRW
ncbi:MAG: hypothetical protein ACYTDX_01345, partial [Planctomycetota bacterium]